MILGEAPGRTEDAMARPFVGASGKLLRSVLLKAGVPLKKCYITNTVKCFPNGTPDKSQIAKCSGKYLKEEIRILNPTYILAVGKVALGAILPGYSLSEVRGAVNQSWVGEALCFAIWHPAYILRNRSKQSEWEREIEDIWTVIQLNEGILPDQRS